MSAAGDASPEVLGVSLLAEPPDDGRPPLLARRDYQRIIDQVEQAVERGARALVILPVRDDIFCGGADIRDVRAQVDDAEAYLEVVTRCYSLVETSAVPIVAAVPGPVVGGGFEIALCCDAVVATTDAWFALPEAGHGLPAVSATRRLAASVGAHRARLVSLTGRRVPAAQAAEWGLVCEVVEPSQLRERAFAVAHELAFATPFAAQAVKSALGDVAAPGDVSVEGLRAIVSSR